MIILGGKLNCKVEYSLPLYIFKKIGCCNPNCTALEMPDNEANSKGKKIETTSYKFFFLLRNSLEMNSFHFARIVLVLPKVREEKT